MTSASYDGDYIARIIRKLGFTAVRGSSSRNAVAAQLGMAPRSRRRMDRRPSLSTARAARVTK